MYFRQSSMWWGFPDTSSYCSHLLCGSLIYCVVEYSVKLKCHVNRKSVASGSDISWTSDYDCSWAWHADDQSAGIIWNPHRQRGWRQTERHHQWSVYFWRHFKLILFVIMRKQKLTQWSNSIVTPVCVICRLDRHTWTAISALLTFLLTRVHEWFYFGIA